MMLRGRSLTTRLVLSHLLATITALIVLGAIVLALLARNLRIETLAVLDTRASVYAVYASELAPTSTTLRGISDTVLSRFTVEPGITVRLFGPDGTLLSANDGIGAFPSREARMYITDQILLLSQAPANRRYVARPIVRGPQTIGIVEVSRALAEERQPLRRLALLLVPGALFALAVATLLALGLARGLLRPLSDLRKVAQRIAAGDLQARSQSRRLDEIGQLATTIDHMADDLAARFREVEQLARSRRDFYRSVSHELRTPLTAIRGLAENLEETATAEQERSLQIMQQETARLQRLVEELLVAGETRFEPVRRRQPVDFGDLVRDVVELMYPRAERAGIMLRVAATAPVMVRGDADRLRQAVVNVLDNALKWTPPGGEVIVHIEASATTASVLVADTGPGIPHDLHERVWERGVHGTDGGQGLGLPLVRAVAEAHGGSAEFVAGPGTTVCIRLPRLE